MKEDVKKKKKKKKWLAHMAITLVICKKYTYYKINLHTITSKQYAVKCLQNFQRGITLPIFGAL